jgi:hypothetical protein
VPPAVDDTATVELPDDLRVPVRDRRRLAGPGVLVAVDDQVDAVVDGAHFDRFFVVPGAVSHDELQWAVVSPLLVQIVEQSTERFFR